MTRVTGITSVVLLTLAASSAPADAQWVSRASGTAQLLEAVWFTGLNDGWIVGDNGTMRFTNDGGATWAPEILTAGDVGDVAFRGAVGLAVGDNGQIFRTTATSWVQVPSGTVENLENVAFGGPGLAYASGRNGVILRSQDDGASWTVAETGAARYRSVAAHGMNAWNVGDGPVVRASIDAGATWFTQASGAPDDLRGVHFVSAVEGWLAGSTATVMYTNDAGATWTPRNFGVSGDLNDVFFVDSLRGWVVGDLGSVFATVDGGLTWTPENSGTLQNLNGLFFLNADWGWVVGDAGTLILRDGVTGAPVTTASVTGAVGVPNPFRSNTVVRFGAAPAGHSAAVTVHDAAGRLVRALDARESAGNAIVRWDGRDGGGAPAPAGVYFLKAAWSGSTARVVLLR